VKKTRKRSELVIAETITYLADPGKDVSASSPAPAG
jgi:hypothetical protein